MNAGYFLKQLLFANDLVLIVPIEDNHSSKNRISIVVTECGEGYQRRKQRQLLT